MLNFYRIEFVRGPHDGLIVEEGTLVAPRLRLPAQPYEIGGAPQYPAALYELSEKALHWEEGTPQAVLRYEFRGEVTEGQATGRLPLGARLSLWRQRLGRWMMTPIDYPMTTRSIR
jgi:hypothetical protein